MASIVPGHQKGETLVAQTVQTVRDYIRMNQLKVGDRLPAEGYFAETVGVSRAVIREAFGALAALRLIDVGNGRRAKVSAMDGSIIATSLDHAVSTAQITLANVWDVRRTLEIRTATLAARNRSDDDAVTIMGLAKQMLEAGVARRDVTEYDIALHEAVAIASGNPLFVQIVSSFAPMMKLVVPAAWRTRTAEAQRDAILDHHMAIARAIVERDAPNAELAMIRHFDSSIGDQLGGAV